MDGGTVLPSVVRRPTIPSPPTPSSSLSRRAAFGFVWMALFILSLSGYKRYHDDHDDGGDGNDGTKASKDDEDSADELSPSSSASDSLSYDVETGGGGPDGSVVKAVVSEKNPDGHARMLRECADVLIDAKRNLRKLSSITLADAVALAGAEAVNAVGGPVLPTQLGRTEAALQAPVPPTMPPLDLFTGEAGFDAVADAFRTSGLTEREMTALLGCLLAVDSIEKATPQGDWKAQSKPKFREAGKIGRMSEFKALSDEDIENELAKDGLDDNEEESYEVSGDDGWYIADTFGTADDRFGKRVSKEKPELSATLKNLSKVTSETTQYDWVKSFLLSKDLPTAQSWVTKYGSKPLLYEKDLKVAYNAVTQLGAEYTGGKYESLLKNKKRKTLNDDELDFLK
ncbi:hypothetical protein ACHAWF_006026 [Thalassiosira exigua]